MLHCDACFREMRVYNTYLESNCACAYKLISRSQPDFLWHSVCKLYVKTHGQLTLKTLQHCLLKTTPQPSMYGIFCLHLSHFRGASIGTYTMNQSSVLRSHLMEYHTMDVASSDLTNTPNTLPLSLCKQPTISNLDKSSKLRWKKTQLGCTWSSSSLAGFINIYKGRY